MRLEIGTILFWLGMLFHNNLHAQNFWEILPVPDTLDVTSVVVNSEDEIFLSTNNAYCGDGIYKSFNGGYNWEKIYNSGPYGIMSMAISDSGVLYALGQYGVELLKSVDNGNSWTVINVPEYVTNQRIFLKGEDTIFVSQWRDEGAFLLRSIDGGQSWDLVLHDYSVGFIIDLAFGSDGSVYAGVMCYMPDGGGIYKSPDEGNTWEFLGLDNHQVSSISIDSSNNLLITVWSNMIDISISGNIYYNHLTNNFSPLYFAWGARGSTINSKNEFFTTFEYGTLLSDDSGQSYELIGGDTAAGCDLYLTRDQYIYGLGYASNYLVKTIQPTVTRVSGKRIETNGLTINPNPIKDQITGEIKTICPDSKGWIEIIDLNGRSILETDVWIVNGNFRVGVSNLTPGFYIINLLTNGSMYSTKIVKG